MSKTILVLSGSPRKNGNTDKLVAAFKEGAESAGKTVALFRVADMKIGACRACEYCHKNNGDCIQKDDMAQIIEVVKKADAIVWASPVYYYSVSAQLKLAIDRFYALVKEEKPIKRAALLLTCEDDSQEAFEGAIATYKGTAGYHGWENVGIVTVTGLHHKDDIDKCVDELEKARQLGREM